MRTITQSATEQIARRIIAGSGLTDTHCWQFVSPNQTCQGAWIRVDAPSMFVAAELGIRQLTQPEKEALAREVAQAINAQRSEPLVESVLGTNRQLVMHLKDAIARLLDPR